MTKMRNGQSGLLTDDDVDLAVYRSTRILNHRVTTSTKERPSTLFKAKLTKNEIANIETLHKERHSRVQSTATFRYGIVGLDLQVVDKTTLPEVVNDPFDFEDKHI